MELTQQLRDRFEKLQSAYPVKRSALIPMLMYAQDEYGCVSDEMIAEIAGRLDLRTVEVEETLAYYSMLHRKPMGKHHVQVCTKVACMGACTGAPAVEVNYDFYENMTPTKFDRIIEDLDKGSKPTPERVISGALHDRNPLETPLLSAR